MKLIKGPAKDNNINYLTIDNWFSEKELNSIWKELEFYSEREKLARSENNLTVTPTDLQKNPLAFSYRIYLDSFYYPEKRNISTILSCQKKFQTPEFYNKIKDIPMARQFPNTNGDTSQVSYYENGDHFKSHYDVFQFTILIWLFKEPKKFEGGDLIFDELNEKVEVKNNRMLFFPSYYIHSVEEIKMKEDIEIGYGRYCITHFYYTTSKGKV
jgi:Rps23 Pro-64 3,4-dihydroxylase Tpa1-like proline 4-hydroxylase